MKTNRTRFSGALVPALITAWTLSTSAWAGAPSLMTYQGRLKEAGLPVTAARSVEIVVCPDLTLPGGCIFTGAQSVSVTNGLFRTTFTTSGWDPTSGPWYLEVRVGGTILTPRERLTSSPYALYASSASTLVASAGTAGVSISTNLFIVNASSVGIGITNPMGRLSILADAGTEIEFPPGSNNVEIQSSNQMVVGTFGGGDLTFKSNNVERMRFLGSNGNVGIGMTNPGAKFHVDASAGDVFRADYLGAAKLLINSAGNVGIGTVELGKKLEVAGVIVGKVNASGTGGAYGIEAGSNHGRLYAHNAYDPANPGVGWTASLSWNNAGNVGIGTTSPGAKLDVQGRIMLESDYGVISTTAPAPSTLTGVHLSAKLGTPYIVARVGTSNPSSAFSVRNSGENDLFWVRGDGNVGIGTTGPGYKLDVNGDVNIAAGSSYRIGGVIQSGSSKWTAGTGDDIYKSLGNVGIGTTAPAARLHVSTTGVTAATEVFTVSTGTLDAEKIFVVKGGGNVGIGATAPASKLVVNYDFAGVPPLQIRQGGITNVLSISNLGAITYNPPTSFGGGITPINFGGGLASATSGEDFFLINPAVANAGNIFHVQRAGLSKMIITDAGNVGIGTTNPGRPLEVNGFVRSANGYDIGTLTVLSQVGSDLQLNNAAASIRFAISGAEMARVAAGGNVGIGTSNPQNRLDVEVSGAVNTARFYNTSANSNQISLASLAATDQANAITFGAYSVGQLGFRQKGNIMMTVGGHLTFATSNDGAIGDQERMRIQAGGKVGIGTTNPGTAGLAVMNGDVGIGTASPGSKLHVLATAVPAGTIQFSDTAAASVPRVLNITHDNQSNPISVGLGLVIGLQGPAVAGGVADYATISALRANTSDNTAHLTFGVTGFGEVMRLTSGGNVGIGTMGANAKLQVVGGDVYTSGASNGLIVKSPDGLTCKRIGIDNTGALLLSAIACP